MTNKFLHVAIEFVALDGKKEWLEFYLTPEQLANQADIDHAIPSHPKMPLKPERIRFSWVAPVG